MNCSFSNLRLGSRNEGKIKSFGSCHDVRAWSHDVQKRDCYLREWIKCDMPICVLPTSTIASLLRIMTCRSKCRPTPRCHPNCKSKVVLDSICNSCDAMKECLKNEEDFDKYFDDEEFETSHWPCERCLEALKSVKMFWKIIVEKLFCINVSQKPNVEPPPKCCRSESVRDFAKSWEEEMCQQAMFVRNITPFFGCRTSFQDSNVWKCPGKRDVPCNTTHREPSKVKKTRTQATDTDYLSSSSVCRSNKSCSSHGRKMNRQCSAKIKTADTECNTCGELFHEVNTYKCNLDFLQEKFNTQKKEIDKLKKENCSLRCELNNVYKNSAWKTAYPSSCASNNDAVAILPKPFECCTEEVDVNKVKRIDSEMIITLKNCKNETYRHISLLQVLHKSNEPILKEEVVCCNRKEDPLELLTKVQNTFGAIVKREMSMASERRCGKKIDIEASFHKIDCSKSAPSCSTITQPTSSSSGSHCKTDSNILGRGMDVMRNSLRRFF